MNAAASVGVAVLASFGSGGGGSTSAGLLASMTTVVASGPFFGASSQLLHDASIDVAATTRDTRLRKVTAYFYTPIVFIVPTSVVKVDHAYS
jgi:hypothetical protein